MLVRDLMTEDPMTATAKTRVREAIEILQTLEVRHLPVVDSKNRLVGMVSDRDLRGASLPFTTQSDVAAFLDRRLVELMAADPLTVDPEDDVSEAIDAMLENKLSAVPVVDADGELLGIVSYVDVLREMRKVLD